MNMVSKDVEKIIEIPVDVYLVKDSGEISTTKNEKEVKEMFKKVNRIWEPANIKFNINKIEPLEISLESLVNIVGIPLHGRPSKIEIDLYYVNNFDGWDQIPNSVVNTNANGFSRILFRRVCVRDEPEPPVTNHRCLAHEFGHILISPDHPPDSQRLMAEGEAGIILIDDEIKTARDTAVRLFS